MSNVLEVRNLSVSLKNGKNRQILVDHVEFSIQPGECLGILGESGSGKSMSIKAIMGLLDTNFTVEGSAIFEGKNLLQESGENLRKIRGNKIAMVLQNPTTCFDPLYRVGSQIAETFMSHTDWNRAKIRETSIELLERMQIRNPEEVLKKYPHQLSGGMLQRIMIGIAIAMEPDVLIADEPTTAIDAITQYEILEEFIRIKNEKNTALLFVTHDLGAISKIADRILVMNQGKKVDEGDFRHIVHNASDSYTKLLVEKRLAVMKKYKEVLGVKEDEK